MLDCSHMPSEYPYISIAGEYYCGRQKVLSLIWILLFRARPLFLHVLGIQRQHIPSLLKAAISPTEVLSLPVSGHICISVNNGHKVFDFSRLTATKVFMPDSDPSLFSAEIDCVREASRLSFTPALLEVDKNARWYTESFAPGERGDKNDSSDPHALFESNLCQNLAEMIQSKPLHSLPVYDHLSNTMDAVEQLLKNSSFDDELCEHVSLGIRQFSANIKKHNNSDITLAFTHGDFSFVNFIYGENAVTVIDWESAQHRSLLHDLYNYYFTELYYKRIPSLHRNDTGQAIEQLNQCLVRNDVQNTGDLAGEADLYRWLYYLERIQMLMEREASPGLRSVILRSIEIFEHFETRQPNAKNN